MADSNGRFMAIAPDMALPPHSIDAEIGLLGSMIIADDPAVVRHARELLSRDDWYQQDHQAIYDALLRMADQGQAIDAITLREELIRTRVFEEVGGKEYLATIIGSVPSASHYASYAGIVREKALLRQTVSICNEALREAYRPRNGEPVAGAARELFALAEKMQRAAAAAAPISSVSARSLMKDNPDLQDPLIVGLLRRAEVMNIISAPKMRKSWMVLQLAVCQCTGRMWLGMFHTMQCRVLIIDGELEPATIAYRLPRVAGGLGVTHDEYADMVDLYSLRGQEWDVFGLDTIIRRIEAGYYGLIIIDPLYTLLPADAENSNTAMMAVYRRLIDYARRSAAGIVVVHHTSKGVQGNKGITDVGAGAGAQARAADGHLVLREHEEPDCAVLEAVVRSWAPLKPIGLRWTYPTWAADPALDVFRLKRDPSKGGRPKKSDADKPAKAEPIEWTPEKFVAEFVTATPTPKDAIVSRARRSKITHRDIQGFLAEAEASELLFVHQKKGSNVKFLANKRQELFDGAQGVCVSHTPPTPPSRRRKKPAAAE